MTPVPLSSDPAARERCSALMDGESDPTDSHGCLERLGRDPALRADWRLWHAVADALHSPEVARLHDERFLRRMEVALAQEPVLLAPQAAAGVRARWLRVGLPTVAVAAAAALVAVVAVPLLTPPTPAPAPRLAAQTAPAVEPLHRSPQIEAYLTAHRELTGAPTLPGSAPYLRAALEAEEGRR